MFGIETLLYNLSGGNDALLMWGALSLVILLNFITTMWVEIKNKDLKWNDMGRFLKQIILNGIFLFGIELVMIPAGRNSMTYDIFANIQSIVWVGVGAYYLFGIYKALRDLGWKGNKRLERKLEELVNDKEEDNY